MALPKNSKTFRHFGYATSVVLFLMVIWLQKVESIPPVLPRTCPPQVIVNPDNCFYGDYVVLPESRMCPPRRYCFIGPNNRCRYDDETTRCMQDYECYCGECHPRNHPPICTRQNYKLRKRVQNNLLEYLM